MDRILITGATGFVGSRLVQRIAELGWSATALVRSSSHVEPLERHGIRTVVGELRDPGSLERAVAEAATVLHLAAATRARSAAEFHTVNAEGTRWLAGALAAAGGGRRLVYLSSLAAAGPARHRPVRPGDEPTPITAYGRSKLGGERAALSVEGLSVAVLRPPAVYGPGDRDLLPFFRLAARRILPVAGDAGRPLQLVHVDDLADAVVKAAETPDASGVFHIAEPTRYAWTEVLDLMARAVGRRGVRVPVPRWAVRGAAAVSEAAARVAGRAVIFDRDKARELLAPGWICETESAAEALGFRASRPLERGLRETAEWYRAYGWL